MKSEPIKVYLVEDHTIVRQGMVALLETAEDMCVVGEAGDGRTAARIYIRSQSERVRNRLPPKLFREARVPDKITAKTSIGLGVVQHFCAGQDALKIHTDQQMKRTAKADLFGRDVRRGKH